MSDEQPTGDIILYQTEHGQTRLEVRLEGGTVWLSQALIAELYQASKQNVSLHLQNIYEDGEREEVAVVKDYLVTAADGKRYQVKHYNLDAFLAVECRFVAVGGPNRLRSGSRGFRLQSTHPPRLYPLGVMRNLGGFFIGQHYPAMVAA
jgi:hypothetical protein